MRWVGGILALLTAALLVRAQPEVVELEDLIEAGREWAEQNLDEDLLRAFDTVDRRQVEQLFREIRVRFQGEYIIDLAPLKQSVAAVLPLLRRHAETRPYAIWLKTRLDYFDVADELRLVVRPPDRLKPSLAEQRRLWRVQLEERPYPKGADYYVERLKPIFSAQRVPTELVWLAEVESSFDPEAVSPVGAAGLYQLMPATARQYGLSLSPRDDRFEPEKNATAAARHLRYLNGRFKDWPLALAAYNAGENRVQSLLAKHRGRKFEDIAEHLPAETQLFVPKVEATLSRRVGVSLGALEPALP
jgi:membrane-bound lytic murein transglycosylase D